MIGLQMRVNNDKLVVNVQAIRIKGKAIEGNICTYDIRIYNQKVSQTECFYGSAIELGHKMLDEYEKLSAEQVNDLYVSSLMKELN